MRSRNKRGPRVFRVMYHPTTHMKEKMGTGRRVGELITLQCIQKELVSQAMLRHCSSGARDRELTSSGHQSSSYSRPSPPGFLFANWLGARLLLCRKRKRRSFRTGATVKGFFPTPHTQVLPFPPRRVNSHLCTGSETKYSSAQHRPQFGLGGKHLNYKKRGGDISEEKRELRQASVTLPKGWSGLIEAEEIIGKPIGDQV